MKRIRISARQVVHYSKVVELDEEEFQELLTVWKDGTDEQLNNMAEDYIDFKSDVVDWDDIEDVDIIDDKTGRLLDV